MPTDQTTVGTHYCANGRGLGGWPRSKYSRLVGPNGRGNGDENVVSVNDEALSDAHWQGGEYFTLAAHACALDLFLTLSSPGPGSDPAAAFASYGLSNDTAIVHIHR
jgi:hypothetical protein